MQISDIWGFICSELIPGAVLSFDLYILLDNSINGGLKVMYADTYFLLIILVISSVILGVTLSSISFILYEGILIKIVKRKKMAEKKADNNVNSLKYMFANLIFPLILFGIVFPKFINHCELQPIFENVFFIMAGLSFCLSILHEYFYRTGTGYSLR